MGTKCKIVKDHFDRVVGVLAPNGQESILFNNILNYFKNNNHTQVENFINNNEENITLVFNDNPDLGKIGSKEQYSRYMDTIFPNSKRKEIFFHGTYDNSNKDDYFRNGVDENGLRGWNYFYNDIGSALNIGMNPYMVLLDFSADINSTEGEYKGVFTNETDNSAIIYESNATSDEYAVKNKNQIHILGSKNDIDGFKNFVNNELINNNSQNELKEAVSLFNTAYTQGFEDYFTDELGNKTYSVDINGDPVLKDVLTYLKSTESNKLDITAKSDFEDFKNQFQSLDYETLENKLYDAFLDFNRNFIIDEQKLLDSNLYNQQEIDNILENTKLQETIKKNILALNKEDFDNTNFENFLNVTIGDEFNSFGKLKTFDPYTLLHTVLENTTNAVSEESFDSLLKQSVSEDVYASIVNSDVYDTLKYMAINLKQIEVKSFENGLIKDVLNKDMSNELKNTLIVSNVSSDTLANLQTLSELDTDVLSDNVDFVIELFRNIEVDLIRNNIDVIGLSEKLLNENVEKVHSFIKALNGFVNSVNEGYLNDDIINTYSDIYNDFFNVKNKKDFVDVDMYDYNVVRIKGELNKFDAYANGYLQIDNDIFVKVTNVSYEKLVDTLAERYNNGENLLENAIPINLKSEKDYREYVDSIVNDYINDFGEDIKTLDLDAFKSIKLFELMYNVEQYSKYKVKNNRSNILELKQNNEDYLNNDFLSELNNVILNSKLNKDILYDKIFKYLSFDNGKIKINDNELLVEHRIQNLLSDDNKIFKTLKNYFKPEVVNKEHHNNEQREKYFNDPSSLRFINSNYNFVKGQVISDNFSDDFIRTNEGTFEKIDNIKGVNIYSKIIKEGNKIHLESLNKQVDGINEIENGVKFNNNYSQSKKESILNEITNCN